MSVYRGCLVFRKNGSKLHNVKKNLTFLDTCIELNGFGHFDQNLTVFDTLNEYNVLDTKVILPIVISSEPSHLEMSSRIKYLLVTELRFFCF